MNPTLLFLVFSFLALFLFMAEVFIPGGIIGAVGLVSLIAACGFAIEAFGIGNGLGLSLGLILVMLAGGFLWLVNMPKSRLGKRFSLQASLDTAKSSDGQPDLVGKTGVAETDLRPSGFARVDGEKLDVVANRGFIESGTAIEIAEVHGSRIVVREHSPADAV
jgi:membrane-bound serine protease (ClpP class)